MDAKQEIIIGLQNAINRGEPLQKAMQSFVNAGYNMDDVNHAAAEVQKGLGTIGKMSPNPTTQTNPASVVKQPKRGFSLFKKKSESPTLPQKTAIPSAPQTTALKKGFPIKIVALIGVLVLLLGALAFILLRL